MQKEKEIQISDFGFIIPTNAPSPEAAGLQHESVESPSGS